MRMKFDEAVFDIRTADTFFSRFLGLMGRRELPEGTGLWMRPCSSIHCCFMRFTIDVIYLDAGNRVLYSETVRPWRIGRMVRGTKSVLELNAGEARGIRAGEALRRVQ
ncbi:DUF192 domain-containing protein [Lachnoclostridium sp. Marseille-P6806]|uniref:DUF192 domain-containing protein n=1 Tax=Lachnoclostridium sp. Marseille-P6806 TaxID=2364793 RepID=UPI0010315F85|nr:DUF192 domain-containing protein [Lachnoclostridium sp. Marseille-P6806]